MYPDINPENITEFLKGMIFYKHWSLLICYFTLSFYNCLFLALTCSCFAFVLFSFNFQLSLCCQLHLSVRGEALFSQVLQIPGEM